MFLLSSWVQKNHHNDSKKVTVREKANPAFLRLRCLNPYLEGIRLGSLHKGSEPQPGVAPSFQGGWGIAESWLRHLEWPHRIERVESEARGRSAAGCGIVRCFEFKRLNHPFLHCVFCGVDLDLLGIRSWKKGGEESC